MSTLNQFMFKNKILMLALDHRGSFKKLVDPIHPETVNDQRSTLIKKQIIDALYQDFSALLVDVETGLPAYRQHVEHWMGAGKPYLLAIEKTGYEDQGGERVTELLYTVKELKEQGAAGIKMLLFFHPHANTAHRQIDLAQRVLVDCKKYNLPFFIEPLTYPLAGDANLKPDIVVEMVDMLLKAGIDADVYKIEYPGDAPSCTKITKMLGKIPWILLTKGDDFNHFVEGLRVAAAHGCVGFLAGRSLWQDFSKLPENKRLEFFNTTVKERFKKISEIVLSY
jgi:tagatose-1,6-bisphosphate aldolase